MSTITLYDPHQLVISPVLSRVATRWDVLDKLTTERDHQETLAELKDEWTAFVEDIRLHGIREPLKIAIIGGKATLLSGRHRRAAAMELGIQVPCEEVPESEAMPTIESSMMLCNAFSKGQRAYVAVLLHPEVALEPSKGGRRAETPALNAGVSDMPTLAAKFGVSLRLIEQACQLFRELDKSATKRAKHEWRVFAGHGLGGIIAGLGGAESTAGKPRPPKADRTVIECLSPLNGFFIRYNALKGEAKDEAFDDAVALLAERQDFEFVEFLAELSQAAVERRAETVNTEGEDDEA